MADPIVNFFKSTLVGTYSNTATSFTIATGDGALLPDPSTDGEFNLVVFEGEAGAGASAFEIVRVTAKTGDVLTVTREQEGTTALTIGADTHSIILSATKKTFDDKADESITITAGDGLTGGGDLSANRTLNVGAGTGINVTADAVSVDVSGFMTNGVDNRVVTATGTDGMNAEANLTFDGSALCVTGNVNATCFIGDGSGLCNLPAASVPDPLTVNRLCVGSGHFSTLGVCSTIAGGNGSRASSCYSAVGGGYLNCITGTFSVVAGGRSNTVDDTCVAIGGGYGNYGSGAHGAIGGGYGNQVHSLVNTIGGGLNNYVAGHYSAIAGGGYNYTFCEAGFVGGGYCNNNNGCYSAILGGQYNKMCAKMNSFIVGSCLSATANCYTFVNNLCNVGGGTSDCRLKENIKPIPYGINQISQLQPVCFNFKDDDSKKTKYGFIAQCVQEIMPDLIYHHPTDKVDNTPVLQFDKDAIWASMVNAIKDLQKQNTELEKRISLMEGNN